MYIEPRSCTNAVGVSCAGGSAPNAPGWHLNHRNGADGGRATPENGQVFSIVNQKRSTRAQPRESWAQHMWVPGRYRPLMVAQERRTVVDLLSA